MLACFDTRDSSASSTSHALLIFSLHAHVRRHPLIFSPSPSLHPIRSPSMTARHVEADEETPLLRSQTRKPQKTPLPWGQFTILLVLQLAEPLTGQVIYPFAPEVSTIAPLLARRTIANIREPSSSGVSASLMETKPKSDSTSGSWYVTSFHSSRCPRSCCYEVGTPNAVPCPWKISVPCVEKFYSSSLQGFSCFKHRVPGTRIAFSIKSDPWFQYVG